MPLVNTGWYTDQLQGACPLKGGSALTRAGWEFRFLGFRVRGRRRGARERSGESGEKVGLQKRPRGARRCKKWHKSAKRCEKVLKGVKKGTFQKRVSKGAKQELKIGKTRS